MVLTPAAVERASALTPTLTPRPKFHVTRKLVGVPKWPLVLLTAVYTINVSDQFLLSSMFPLLKREFGLSDTALGILSGSYLISVTLGTVPFGALADRYSRTRIIAWGTAFWGVTMIFTGMAGGFVMLLLGRMVLGLWDPCDNPTSQSLLADYYPVNQRSKVMGIYQMGQLTGFFLLPIGGLMGQAWGWRATFYFFALPAFVVALLSWRLPEPVRGVQERRHQRLESDESTVIASRYQNFPIVEAYKHILRLPLVHGQPGVLRSRQPVLRRHRGVDADLPHPLPRPGHRRGHHRDQRVAVGGLVGVLTAGNLADFLTHSGYLSARIGVAGIARLISAPLFLAAFLVSYTPLMLLLLSFGALFLVAAIPAPQRGPGGCSASRPAGPGHLAGRGHPEPGLSRVAGDLRHHRRRQRPAHRLHNAHTAGRAGRADPDDVRAGQLPAATSRPCRRWCATSTHCMLLAWPRPRRSPDSPASR